MTQKIRDYLGITIIISIIIVALSAWSYVRTYSRSVEPSSFRSFSVTGEGKVVAVPDVAEFSFSVVTQGGKDIASLQEENVKKVNAAIDFIKLNGVEAKDVKTQNYSVEPRYQYYSCNPIPLEDGSVRPCPPAEIVGYSITQSVLVKVRDFSKVGEILSGVVDKGANTVSQLNFTIDDPSALQNEARAEAIEKAKTKAKLVARVGGFSVGRLLNIEESSYFPPIYYAKETGFGRGGGDLSYTAPVVEPGSQEVTVSVVLRYEIR
ncbi:MAG: 26 kDa periplasmic immunogenic protein [Candidatus Jorgensenbacteria bacterium GW2011_GWC1_48_8]|uniref:26 kDa periplasmic immunogenic protein n=2 Tax=Candidatus Joergenseniibacteriota TaxID=1752739 RepID=A0A0G1W794_9BACT|nr:MAG: 26 kDa periplasmic immunogenic protein [Candidatus Jorgensenbacteria bacterium GW2011_GWC1_48_8]KKW14616.1 MAG: 26 kDa periplasmic immunogenic protein [Candidatus Jorgensenbacteria bacterium GW2011_GWB1_50_10]